LREIGDDMVRSMNMPEHAARASPKEFRNCTTEDLTTGLGSARPSGSLHQRIEAELRRRADDRAERSPTVAKWAAGISILAATISLAGLIAKLAER
jgi:hypothetical protein